MMKSKKSLLNYILNIFIGLVWLINGLICKVLNLVPRHEDIVGSILGHEHSFIFTFLIGISEIIMAFWIWSRFKSRWSAILQMVIVASMNVIEFIIIPDLLLWGKTNALFALLFICLVYINEFILKPSKN